MGHKRELVTATYWISGQYATADALWDISAWERVDGGITQPVHSYRQYDEDRIKEDMSRRGTFSPRPFIVGRWCDGTADECCDALTLDFCEKSRLDTEALRRETYHPLRGDAYQACDYRRAKQIAQWQGITYPPGRGQEELFALPVSLYAIHSRRLVAVLAAATACRALGSEPFFT